MPPAIAPPSAAPETPLDGDADAYRPMAEINITPLVDVVLVLLVIFMVTAPLMVGGASVELPRSASARVAPPPKPLVITLFLDGRLQLRDDPVDRSALVDRLRTLRYMEGESTVYIRADRKIPYGDVVELLGRISEAGYRRTSLLSQQPTAAPPPKSPR